MLQFYFSQHKRCSFFSFIYYNFFCLKNFELQALMQFRSAVHLLSVRSLPLTSVYNSRGKFEVRIRKKFIIYKCEAAAVFTNPCSSSISISTLINPVPKPIITQNHPIMTRSVLSFSSKNEISLRFHLNNVRIVIILCRGEYYFLLINQFVNE